MLCQFSFQNFKSYRDETVFDLQATAIPEFKDNLIVKDKCSDLLPVSVIYGPNGGGKTNLIRALSCLITTVVRPIHDLGSTRKRVIMQQKVVAEPFLLIVYLKMSLQNLKFSFVQKNMSTVTI